MSRKQRPAYADYAALIPGASIRDAAAVLGINVLTRTRAYVETEGGGAA